MWNGFPLCEIRLQLDVGEQKKDGVKVIVLGDAADVEKELGIVVLDPTTVTFKMAEAVIDVGIRHCKRGLYATLIENAQTRDAR